MVVGVSGDVEYQVRLEPPPARRWLLIAAALIITRGVKGFWGAGWARVSKTGNGKSEIRGFFAALRMTNGNG